MRGLPGSGKSTVARQLAGERGVVLNLEANVHRSSQAGSGESYSEPDTMVDIQQKHQEEFQAEVQKGTPIIVIDNTNIQESEYLHYIEYAR